MGEKINKLCSQSAKATRFSTHKVGLSQRMYDTLMSQVRDPTPVPVAIFRVPAEAPVLPVSRYTRNEKTMIIINPHFSSMPRPI